MNDTITATHGHVRWELDAERIVTATMDAPDAGANTLSNEWAADFGEFVDWITEHKDAVGAAILTSAKKTFFAGANLKEFLKLGPESAQQIFDDIEYQKSVMRRLETCGVPVVAAINGAAMGGGCEVALACHHRIISTRAQIGLPETTLGLLPGAGGVTRLVRMMGIEKALTGIILEGRTMRAQQALEFGLVDEVSEPENLLAAAHAWALAHRDDAQAATKPWDVNGHQIPGGTPSSAEFARNLPAFPASLRKKLKGSPLLAPKKAMAVAVEGAQVDFDTALRIESRGLVELAIHPQARNMIQAFFFDMQVSRSGGLRPEGIEPRRFTRLGMLGAGMMGAGIAHACASAGIEVVLKDVDAEAAERGVGHVRKLLDKQVDRGRTTAEKRDEILARIHPTGEASDLAGCDLMIEAVFEDADLKAKVYAEAEPQYAPDALLCSNTSTLPITELAEHVSRPEDFIGLHFFSPVDKMKLVEIIRGERTSDAALAGALDVVKAIGKLPIVVNDGPGFFTSRVWARLVTEAPALLGDGVDPVAIERGAHLAGFPGAPLAMLDEVSLTLVQHIKVANEGKLDLDTAVIDRMVTEFGRKGRAAGTGGFYDYGEGREKHLWHGLYEHFVREEAKAISLRDVKDRMLFAMAHETAKCFEVGVLTDTASANIGSIFGIGFPTWTGGAAQFMVNYHDAEDESLPTGLPGFVARADQLADAYGERFRPSQWLRDRAEAGAGLV